MNSWNLTAVAMALAGAGVAAQTPAAPSLADLRKLYDAGKYQQVLKSAAAADEPRIIYLEGQTDLKLRQADAARADFRRLADRPEDDPWHSVGQSALALLAQNAEEAVQAAGAAVTMAPDLAEAQLQRGLALSAAKDMDGAFAAFEQAATLDPGWADAHYYAGIAASKLKKVDRMAEHFRLFLTLAPQSPQRPEVLSIMKTVG